jgi:hypothetical protein
LLTQPSVWSQEEQVVEPGLLNVPAGQSPHVVVVGFRNCPPVQRTQDTDPVALLCEPGGQTEHDVEPVEPLYAPFSHWEQTHAAAEE